MLLTTVFVHTHSWVYFWDRLLSGNPLANLLPAISYHLPNLSIRKTNPSCIPLELFTSMLCFFFRSTLYSFFQKYTWKLADYDTPLSEMPSYMNIRNSWLCFLKLLPIEYASSFTCEICGNEPGIIIGKYSNYGNIVSPPPTPSLLSSAKLSLISFLGQHY